MSRVTGDLGDRRGHDQLGQGVLELPAKTPNDGRIDAGAGTHDDGRGAMTAGGVGGVPNIAHNRHLVAYQR